MGAVDFGFEFDFLWRLGRAGVFTQYTAQLGQGLFICVHIFYVNFFDVGGLKETYVRFSYGRETA